MSDWGLTSRVCPRGLKCRCDAAGALGNDAGQSVPGRSEVGRRAQVVATQFNEEPRLVLPGDLAEPKPRVRPVQAEG